MAFARAYRYPDGPAWDGENHSCRHGGPAIQPMLLGAYAYGRFLSLPCQGAIPPHLPESQAQNQVVMEAMAQAASRLAQAGYDVVVDGIVGPWFLGPWRRLRIRAGGTLYSIAGQQGGNGTAGLAPGQIGPGKEPGIGGDHVGAILRARAL